jgi:hypothetical protein
MERIERFTVVGFARNDAYAVNVTSPERDARQWRSACRSDWRGWVTDTVLPWRLVGGYGGACLEDGVGVLAGQASGVAADPPGENRTWTRPR